MIHQPILCVKCGATMVSGIAIEQTYTSGMPDWPGDEPDAVVTMSPGGPGKVINCMKCPECGHSVKGTLSMGTELKRQWSELEQAAAMDMQHKPWGTDSRNRWDRRFFGLAQHYAEWSKDPSTQCGAVITLGNRQISQGYNGFPAGTADDPATYADRDIKYQRVLHAELNAIIHAKQDLKGCTIYVFPLIPCSQCMAAIIQAGIIRVVTAKPEGELKERWAASNAAALALAAEAGVSISYVGA